MSDVKVKFGAEDENLNATLGQVKKNLKDVDVATGEVSKGFSVGFKTIAAGAAAGALAVKAAGTVMNLAMDGARAVVDKFGDALDFGGKMDDMTKATGIAADELVILERAFENTGVGGDKLGLKMGKMQKFIEGASDGAKAQTDTLKKLGISYDDLQGKAPTEQMRILANAIAGINDPGRRAALAMEVFGGKTADIMPFLLNFDAELKNAKEEVGGFAAVMGRSSDKFDTLGDKLKAVKNKTLEFAAGFLERALPALIAFTERLGDVDAAGWGDKLMAKVQAVAYVLVGAFTDSQKAVDYIGQTLETAAKGFGNFVLNSMYEVSEKLGVVLWSYVLKGWESLKFIMLQTAANFSKVLIRGFAEVAAAINPLLGPVMNKLISPIMDGLSTASSEYGADMEDAHATIDQQLKDTMSSMTSSTEDFFGAQPALEKLREDTKKLETDGKKFVDEFVKATSESESIKTNFEITEEQVELMNQEAAEIEDKMKVGAVKFSQDVSTARNDVYEIKKMMADGLEAIDLTFNSYDAVEKVRQDLSQAVDLSLNSSKGSEILTDLKAVVETIRDYVKMIEPKLPQRSLV